MPASGPSDPGRPTWVTGLLFALLGGGAAETFEVLRLQLGGIAPPGLGLRAALWFAYGLIAFGSFAVARLALRRGALTVAATALVATVVLPWLNFAYLPRAGSTASVLGSFAAIAGLAVLVPLLLRRRRAVAWVAAAVIVGANTWGLFADAGERRGPAPAGQAALPFNVVVVVIDTLRADHLGAYGYARPTSPHFDALASEGVLFERAVAQAPWTKPSIASLMTGRFPHKHGVVSSRDALGADFVTLAERMQARGFQTAAFSGNPWITPEFRFDQGFAEFEGGRAMGPQLTVLYKTLRRVDRLLVTVGRRTNLAAAAFWGSSGNVDNSSRDRLLTDAVVQWIGRQQAAQPFFLYLHLIGPHDPYDPPLEYVRPFREANWDGVKGPTKPPARVQTVFESAAPLADVEQAALIAQYDGAIAFADAQLGRIVDALRASGQLERTLLVVTADHGEEFYEHRNWRHGNQLYNEVVHVPLLFHLPGRLPAARRPDLAMIVDIYPTLAGMIDGSAPSGDSLDGRALFAASDAPAPLAFAEHWWMEGGTYSSRMVQRGAFKLTETRQTGREQEHTELYDLATDRSEERNLLENPDPVRDNELGELRGLLARFGDKVSVGSTVAVDVDQSTKERLRQLGY